MKFVATAAKVTRPTVNGQLERGRLLRMLQVGDPERRVFHIFAPAGSGKTSLVANYTTRTDTPTLWYRATSEDTDPASVFHHLRIGAAQLNKRMRRLPQFTPEFATDPVPFGRRFFKSLFLVLAEPITLVFDDCHEVPETAAFHAILKVVCDELPNGSQLIMLSRKKPHPCLSRLILDDRLIELRGQEMALTDIEATELARLSGVSETSMARAVAVGKWVNGWMAGFILALRRPTTRQLLPQFDTDADHQLLDYVASELLDHQGMAERRLLAMVSLFPWVTAALARSLTGIDSIKEILERLVSEGLFLTRRQGDPPIYEFHSLFREVLSVELKKHFTPGQAKELTCRAGDLLGKAGAVEEAATLLIQVQAWPQLSSLVRNHAQRMVDEGRHTSLRNLLNSLPNEIVEIDSALSYWQGLASLYSVPAESNAPFARAALLYEANGDIRGRLLAFGGQIEARYNTFSEFRKFDSLFDEFENDISKHLGSLELHQRGRLIAAVFLAMAFRRPGHDGTRALRPTIRNMSYLIPDRTIRALLKLNLTTYYLWRGEMPAVKRVVDRMGPLSSTPEYGEITDVITSLVRTVYYQHAGEFDLCLEAAECGLKVSEATGITLWRPTLSGMAAVASLAAGKLDIAKQFLTKMVNYLNPLRTIEVWHLRSLEAWYCLEHGDIEQAVEYVEEATLGISNDGLPYFTGLTASIALEVFVVAGKFPNAQTALAQLLAAQQETGNLLLEWFYYLAKARIGLAQGDQVAGIDSLNEALAFGRAKGFRHGYFWPRAALTDLFTTALEHGIEIEYVKDLVAFNKMNKPVSPLASGHWPWPVKIWTLGTFRIECNGELVESDGKPQKMPLGLLKALIAFGCDNVSENQLADVLWPDSDGAQALQALATTLMRLRRIIGAEAVIRQGGRLSINHAVCWVDARALQSVLSARKQAIDFEFDATTKVYRGRFLENETSWSWCVPLREKLHAAICAFVTRSAQSACDQGRLERMVEICDTGIAIHDVEEEFYRLKASALILLGRPEAALATYSSLESLLGARFGATLSTSARLFVRSLVNTDAKSV